MSFLASLFCCFDNTQDQERPEQRLTSSRTHLSRTQSNLQKALQYKNWGQGLDANQKTSSAKKSCSTFAPDIKKEISEEGEEDKGKSGTVRQEGHSSDKKDTQQTKVMLAVQSKNMDHSDTASTREGEVCDLKTQAVNEITDHATDSSKDDETLNNDHRKNEKVLKNDKRTTELPSGGKVVEIENTGELDTSADAEGDVEMAAEAEDESLEEELYGGQTQIPSDLDLTKILSDQVVTKSGWLLDEQPKKLKGRKTLVLDLDETLVHSSFKYVRHCDFVIPVEIENQIHNVYVIKRPGVDEFLRCCGELFEVVVFTASVARYGDPLLDILDTHHSVHQRLFRESCYNYQGNYIKNLSQMGRPLEDLIIIDNSPASYIFHPQHSVPISSWFSDTHDCELTDLLPLLRDLASKNGEDVRLVLDVNI